MKRRFPTDDSVKSLAPFFSPPVISAMLYSLAAVTGLTLFLWPREPVFFYIGSGRGPVLFFQSFCATLILQSYLNLRCGRGELAKIDFTRAFQKEETVHEKETPFLGYGFIVCSVHSLFILFPFLPVLIAAGAVSSIPPSHLVMALSVLAAAGLLSRYFGVLAYLLLGRTSVSGYLVVRGFAVFYLFATALVAPVFNPLRMLYLLNKTGSSPGPFWQHSAASLAAMVMLVTMNTLAVKRHIGRAVAR